MQATFPVPISILENRLILPATYSNLQPMSSHVKTSNLADRFQSICLIQLINIPETPENRPDTRRDTRHKNKNRGKRASSKACTDSDLRCNVEAAERSERTGAYRHGSKDRVLRGAMPENLLLLLGVVPEQREDATRAEWC
jgi:hypothetical protein